MTVQHWTNFPLESMVQRTYISRWHLQRFYRGFNRLDKFARSGWAEMSLTTMGKPAANAARRKSPLPVLKTPTES